ncbi:hypothetical protein [Maribellus sp. YY47]|uniref:hypothetical protein n=1 Tax=Maribellus sp. YY47 TaxID=2929486 RepID=UPI002000CF64|nr:hypothetical protein [Maribellus sp. YY47]MCK3684896.1 hypothetical protein [Maribellus sp. YY47]
MKALKYFIIIAVVALFAACEDDVERELSPEQNPNSTNVYFSKDNVSNVVLPIESTSFEVIVSREVSASEQTVSLSAENVRSDLFTIPESVTFAAGEKQKSITVEVSEEIVLMESYHLAIVIDQEQTKPYTQQDVYPRIELTISKEDFAPYADGVYTSDFFGDSWDATLQYSPATDQYRFKDNWVSGYNYIFKVAEDGTITQVPETTETGYVDEDYGMISATAQAGSSFDSATNTYTFAIKWTVSAGSYGVYNDTFEITSKY